MNWFRGVLLSVVVGVGVGSAMAEENYGAKAGRKLGMGAANIVTSWLEVPKTMINTYNQTNFIFGITGGFAKGLLNTGGRAITGTIDVLTFYVPTKPVPQPPMVWDNFDADTSYGPAFRLDTDDKAE
ncbi:MAG: hypothetical protein Kow0060_10250 [Methylohalobius crimeensis]